MDKVIGITGVAFIIVLLVVLGIIFINGRGSDFIAGFNTMSPEKKKKYDIVSLTKFVGRMMFFLAISALFWILSMVYEIESLFTFGTVLFVCIVVFMVIYANTGNRFKK